MRLGSGDFFGEMACCGRPAAPRPSRAVTRVNLLVLSADDFHVLMERKPASASASAVAEARVGKERVVRGGDIISEELTAAADNPDAPRPEKYIFGAPRWLMIMR